MRVICRAGAEQSKAEIDSFTLILTPPEVISSTKLWNLNNEDSSTGRRECLLVFIPRLPSKCDYL